MYKVIKQIIYYGIIQIEDKAIYKLETISNYLQWYSTKQFFPSLKQRQMLHLAQKIFEYPSLQ